MRLHLVVGRLYSSKPTKAEDIALLKKHPEAAREMRTDILHDLIRAACQESMRVLFRGDQSYLDKAHASDALIKEGVSYLVRGCAVDEIPALKEELKTDIDAMDIVASGGRALWASFPRN